MRLGHRLLTLMRVLGATLIILGIGFWTGHWYGLVPLHRALGTAFVLSLWAIAALAIAARRSVPLAAAAVAWGLVVAGLGMSQQHILTGDYHWIVRVLHLGVAMASMPLAGRLATQGARS